MPHERSPWAEPPTPETQLYEPPVRRAVKPTSEDELDALHKCLHLSSHFSASETPGLVYLKRAGVEGAVAVTVEQLRLMNCPKADAILADIEGRAPWEPSDQLALVKAALGLVLTAVVVGLALWAVYELVPQAFRSLFGS